ncbi:MAG: hypothetical protein HZB63_09235, partial [Deltaproteobacteria bacterium]|nr:hypothetical protein [Deltaproteobacteria bacterium]
RRREDPFRSPAEVASFLAGQGLPAGTLSILSTSRLSGVYTIRSIGKAGGKIARYGECQAETGGVGPKSVKIRRWTDYVAAGEEAVNP